MKLVASLKLTLVIDSYHPLQKDLLEKPADLHELYQIYKCMSIRQGEDLFRICKRSNQSFTIHITQFISKLAHKKERERERERESRKIT